MGAAQSGKIVTKNSMGKREAIQEYLNRFSLFVKRSYYVSGSSVKNNLSGTISRSKVLASLLMLLW